MGFDVRTYAQNKRKREEGQTGSELKEQVTRSKQGGFDVRSYVAQKDKSSETKSTLLKIAEGLKGSGENRTAEQKQADELWNGYDYNAEAERRRQAGGYTPASAEYRAVDTETNRMDAQGVSDWEQTLADRKKQEDAYVATVSDVSSEEAARDAWKKMHPEWYNEDGSPVVNIYGTDINVNSDRGKDYWDLELRRRDAEREATEAAGYADTLRNGEDNSRAGIDPVQGQYELEQLRQQRAEMEKLGYSSDRITAIDEQIAKLESDLEAIEYSRLLLNYSRLAGDVQSDIAGQQSKIASYGTDEAYADALKAQDKANADYERQQVLDPTEARIQIEELRRQIAELDAQLQPLDAVQAGQKFYGNELWDARQKQKDRLETQLHQLEGDLEAMERSQQLAQYGKYADEADFGLNSRFNYNYRDGGEGSTIAYIPTGEEASYGFFGGATTTELGSDAEVLYGYVNKVQDVINANENNIRAIGGDPLTSDKYLVAIKMTDEERSIFNYLFNTGRQEEAQKYFELLTPDLNYRYRAAEEERYRQMAEENPLLTSLFTVLTSPDKMITLGGQALDYIEDGKIDENAPYNMYSHIPTAVRGQVSQMVEKKYGKAGSFGYQTGMSILDNVYQMAITGGASGEGFMLAIMGSGAAADSVLAAKARGLTDDRAFALGLVSGAVEAITEKIGLDAFYDGIIGGKTALRAMLQSTLAEGSEEIASTVLDDIADMIIAGVDSERMKLIEQYKAQGMSDSEAVGKAFTDLLKEAGVSGLGGALSGLLMSGGAQALMNSYNAVASRTSQRAETKASLREAEEGLQALRDAGYGEQFDAELAEQNAQARTAAEGAQTTAQTTTDTTPAENAIQAVQTAQSEGTQAVPVVTSSVTPKLERDAMAAMQKAASNSFGKAGAEAAMSAYDPQSAVGMNDYLRDFARTYNAALEGKTATDTVLTAEQYNAAIQAANADRTEALQTAPANATMETEQTAQPTAEVTPLKQAQYEALQKADVTDEYNTPIASPAEIMTFEEAVNAERSDFGSTLDYDLEDAENALRNGEITVYGAGAIKPGSFVSPSRISAEAFADGRRIYSMTVPLDAVAWTDAGLGQFVGELEGINNGREGNGILSDRSERNDSSRAGEQAEGVVGSAGQARSGNESGQETGARSETEGADSLTVAEEKVTSADLGIKDGRADDNLQVVTDGTSEDYKLTKALAEKLGYKVTLVKGSMHVEGVERPVRGVIQGKNVWIQMDEPDFTGYQILQHEHAHELIDSGEIDENAVRDRIAELYGGREAIDTVARLYAELHSLSTAEEAWTEIVCDSYADMNAFAKDTGSFAAYYQQMLQDVRSNLDAKANTERGPPRANKNAAPEGGAKYSVEKVKNRVGPENITLQADTNLISENIKNGNSALDRLFAEAENSDNAEALIEKNAMFRTDLGDIDFMWGKPGKGADFHSGFGIAHIVAKRNAENGRGIETAYEMVDVIAKATQGEIQRSAGSDNCRIRLHYNGNTAVLSAQNDSNKWLLTGWGSDINESEAYAAGEVHDSSGATAAVPTRTRYSGVDASDTETNVSQRNESVKTESFDKTGISYDADTESANPQHLSRATWIASDYVEHRKEAAAALAKALSVSQKKALAYIDDVNSIAKMIGDDQTRLDYTASPGRSSFVGNTEYGGSIDFSTICKKRRLFTGTIEAIQEALPDRVITADDMIQIRQMMLDKGYEAACGLWYVEGSRVKIGTYTKQFLDQLREKNAPYIPTQAEMSTATGQERIRAEHPEVYDEYVDFMNKLAQRKPKMFQLATEYKGEILEKFGNKDAAVDEKNVNGGIRMQSFSDFEIIHLIDCMQAIMDMARVGLASQAYTKVPDFAWALGDTGLKINLSMIAKGVDANGRIIFDEREGMKEADAMRLRDRYSDNVGTICVVFDDAQLKAAMADDRIDFIIPFHRSQWNKGQYEALGLPATTKDYTPYQNESYIEPVYRETRDGGKKKLRPDNYMPNSYWDFSKSGKENAEAYLTMCAENNRKPKFSQLLVNNGDGSYSLQPDGSTDGYWKLLIDFKMYNNEGVGVPQKPVQPRFNMDEARRMLSEYEGGHEKFPVAQDVVDEFLAESETQRLSRGLFDPEALEKQNEQLRKDLQAATAALAKAQSKAAYWEGQTKRSTAPSPNPTDINRLAHDIVSNTDTNLKAKDIAPELAELATYIMRGGDGKNELTWSGVKERAVGIAHRMLQNYSELLDSFAVQDYKDIRKRVRDYGTIKVPGNDLPPDWTDWKRRHGWLRVAVSTGTPLDVVYTDLSESYPWFFPKDANPGSDQLYALVDGIHNAEPAYWNPNNQDMAEATEYLSNRIIDGVIEDVSQDKTYADKMAKRLRDQRYDATQKLEATKAELKAAVQQTRARSDERLNNLKAHYREVQENARARKAEGNMRTRLLKIAKRLQDKKLPTPSRALVNEYVGYIDTVAKNMTGKTRDKLQALSELYNYELENNPDFTRDEAIEKKLSRLNAVRISDLTVEQVQDLIDVLLGLEHQLNNAKRELDSADRRDVYQKGVQIIGDVKGGHTVKPQYMETLDNLFVRNTLSPLREIRRQTGYVDGDPLYEAGLRLNRGQLRMNDYVMKNSKTFDEWVQDKAFMESLTGKKANTIKVRGAGMNGQPVTVEITPDMRISLYLHNKNLQNQQHISSMSGGVKVPDIKLYRAGKIAEAYAKGTRIRLQPSEIRAVCENMTAKERALAERIYKYFNTTSRNALSDEFERLKGYMMRFVEDYFPIDTDGSFTKANAEAINFDGSLEGSGWLKERVVNAKNPIMLYDATSVLLKAIQAHGQFVGLAVPIRDFTKLYGMNGPVYDEAKNRIGSQSVKETIKQTWGTGATDYIDKMLGDLQKTHTESNSWTDLFRQIRSNYAGATLALNLSVALKQAGSYPTAAAVLGWKPLARAMTDFGKVDLDYIASLTPLQWLRSQGYSTPELGDLKAKGRQLPPALNWIQGMDLLTTRKLWKACEYYMQENHPDLKRGSDQYNGTISELYNRVIEETQPNYTVMQRPQLLRSNSELIRDVSMFKTQLFQNFNIFYDAFGNMAAKHQQYQANPNAETKAKYEEAKKNAGRASSALIVQSVVIAAMTLAWNALRGKLKRYKDEEKDKITGWSFAKRFGLDVASGFFGMVPFGSEVFSMISSKLTGEKWYGFEGVTTGALTDFFSTLMSAFTQIGKSLDAAQSGQTAAIQKQVLAWEDIAENTAKVFGVPAENVMNLIKAVYGSITKTACGKYYGEYLSMLATTPIENNKGKYYDLLYNAEKSGNMDQFWEIYNSLVALDAMASEKKSTVENIDAALKQREKKDK